VLSWVNNCNHCDRIINCSLLSTQTNTKLNSFPADGEELLNFDVLMTAYHAKLCELQPSASAYDVHTFLADCKLHCVLMWEVYIIWSVSLLDAYKVSVVLV
jgi:hypothetical protein